MRKKLIIIDGRVYKLTDIEVKPATKRSDNLEEQIDHYVSRTKKFTEKDRCLDLLLQ